MNLSYNEMLETEHPTKLNTIGNIRIALNSIDEWYNYKFTVTIKRYYSHISKPVVKYRQLYATKSGALRAYRRITKNYCIHCGKW